MLNAVLTVRAHQANSHKDKGWETFTDAVVQWLSNNQQGLVFMLWGSYAQKKGAAIDRVSLPCSIQTQYLYTTFMHLTFVFFGFVEAPSRPAGCASVSTVGSSRVLWLQAFLQSQRAATGIRKDSCRLERTLSCSACRLF